MIEILLDKFLKEAKDNFENARKLKNDYSFEAGRYDAFLCLKKKITEEK